MTLTPHLQLRNSDRYPITLFTSINHCFLTRARSGKPFSLSTWRLCEYETVVWIARLGWGPDMPALARVLGSAKWRLNTKHITQLCQCQLPCPCLSVSIQVRSVLCYEEKERPSFCVNITYLCPYAYLRFWLMLRSNSSMHNEFLINSF